MDITQKKIQDFITSDEIAVLGVSRDSKKFGYQAYSNFKKNQYKVYPINPYADKIDSEKCYKSIFDLPDSVKSLVIITKPEYLLKGLEDANEKGIQNIWIQKGLHNDETLNYAKDHFDLVIYGECIFMWTDPVKGVHSMHKGIRKLFGGLPK
jgi:predicted CoA-binding protein